jgi:hypothetical protein
MSVFPLLLIAGLAVVGVLTLAGLIVIVVRSAAREG